MRAPYSSATCGLDGIPAGEPVAWFVHARPAARSAPTCAPVRRPSRRSWPVRLERLAGPPGPPVTGGPSDGGIGTSGPDAVGRPRRSRPGPQAPTDSTERERTRTQAACSTTARRGGPGRLIGAVRQRRADRDPAPRPPHPTPDPRRHRRRAFLRRRPRALLATVRGTCHPTCRPVPGVPGLSGPGGCGPSCPIDFGDPRRQRPTHLLELRASGHLLGVDRGLDAVEQPLEPADQLGLGDPQLALAGRPLVERQ